jgi:conjugal transfer ATP-binding protein TraC
LSTFDFQVFGPDQELDFRAPFVGRLAPDCYCAAVAIKSFPVEPRAGLMNIATGGIFRDRKATEGGGPKITTPFIYTTTVRVANQRAEGTRVQRAIDSRLNKSAPFTLGREDAERKLRDLKTIQQQCAEGEDKYVYVSTSAFVFGRTPGEARSSAGVVAGLLDKLKFDAREVVDNIGVRLAQALPLNYSLRVAEALDSEAIMSSSGCAMVLPLYGDYTGNVPLNSKETGWPLITRRGQLMSTDVWRAKSPHGVIVAQTGAGKSVVVQSKIKTHLASGTRVVVVESGRSLYKFCDAVGGDHIDPAINRPSLNGFSLLETEEDFVDQEELLTDLGMQMCYFNEEVVSGGRIAMGEAVKAAYANRGNRADYYTVVESLEAIVRGATGIDSDNEITTAARALVPRLKSFLDNPARGSFFRGQCAMDVNAQLTVFELDGLGESHLKKCVMSFIMNVVLSRLRLHPGRKVIMIEEAADILKDPNDAGVVGGIYRKGRKDLVAIWAVFQSLLQMLKLPAGELIFGQSYWKFLMHQDAAEIDKLVAGEKLGKFNNDAFYVQLLKSVDTIKPLYSEVLVQSGDTYEVGRLFLDRFTLGLFESEGASRERIFALMKDGMDVVEAVELVIGEGNSKRRRWVDDFVSELRDVQGLSPSEIRAAVQEALQ